MNSLWVPFVEECVCAFAEEKFTVCLGEVEYCSNVLSEKSLYLIFRKMRSHQVRTEKQRMPLLITSKVNKCCKGHFSIFFSCFRAPKIAVLCLCLNCDFVLAADGLAYSALLKNELLGAGIEKIQDPQTEDRRLQPSTPEKRSLFTV